MKVRSHRLYGNDNRVVPFVKASKSSGALNQEYLIMHYTAGGSATQTVNFFKGDSARASAHLVIGRDGSIVQMLKFDTIAWHAGQSTWANRARLNPYSIGIEIANWGLLEESEGSYKSWTGATIPAGSVIRAPHKHTPNTNRYWEVFPEAQMEASIEAAAAIVAEYNIPSEKILGHDDISPGRKIDPGPAFNLASFKARVAGREDGTGLTADEYRVVSQTGLNLRRGPGVDNEVIVDMADGTRVRRHIGEEIGRWWFVSTLDNNGNEDRSGYAHSRWLVAV